MRELIEKEKDATTNQISRTLKVLQNQGIPLSGLLSFSLSVIFKKMLVHMGPETTLKIVEGFLEDIKEDLKVIGALSQPTPPVKEFSFVDKIYKKVFKG